MIAARMQRRCGRLWRRRSGPRSTSIVYNPVPGLLFSAPGANSGLSADAFAGRAYHDDPAQSGQRHRSGLRPACPAPQRKSKTLSPIDFLRHVSLPRYPAGHVANIKRTYFSVPLPKYCADTYEQGIDRYRHSLEFRMAGHFANTLEDAAQQLGVPQELLTAGWCAGRGVAGCLLPAGGGGSDDAGVASVQEAAWERYRTAGYSPTALLEEEVRPSVAAAHAHVEALASALAEAYRLGSAKAPLAPPPSIASWKKSPTNESAPQPLPSQASLLDTLLKSLEDNLQTGVPAISVAMWAHHTLTQIRPYTDGNARAAFLLTNYILGREGIAPLLLWREQRYAYYQALKAADQGTMSVWGALFLQGLQQATLSLLSWGYPHNHSLEEALKVYNRRHQYWRGQQNRDRSQTIMNNRYTIFDYVEEILGQIAGELSHQGENGESTGVPPSWPKPTPTRPITTSSPVK